MTAYRLYLMSNRTGHIERFEVIDARDDVDAVAKASRMAGPQAMELWQEARRIHHFQRRMQPDEAPAGWLDKQD
ncbi:MAG TPA: hypothetical protein VF649_12135 [Sphingomonas sp.]|jgi:hypothetical protein|uniref:hypothetical protein n=1 Tax=Sphingomonas sp. TaxID=28214 RepID=UPI002EDB9C3C